MVKIHIDEKLCKGCYYCIETCNKEVLARSDVLSPKGYIIVKVENPEDCIACRLCERICPDFAISVHETKSKKDSDEPKNYKSNAKLKVSSP